MAGVFFMRLELRNTPPSGWFRQLRNIHRNPPRPNCPVTEKQRFLNILYQ
jgi:hypothetical protein